MEEPTQQLARKRMWMPFSRRGQPPFHRTWSALPLNASILVLCQFPCQIYVVSTCSSCLILEIHLAPLFGPMKYINQVPVNFTKQPLVMQNERSFSMESGCPTCMSAASWTRRNFVMRPVVWSSIPCRAFMPPIDCWIGACTWGLVLKVG